MDFILECYALDHPDEYTFLRPDKPKPPKAHDLIASWESRLIGKAHDKLMRNIMPSAAVLKRAAEIQNSALNLRRMATKMEPPPEKSNA